MDCSNFKFNNLKNYMGIKLSRERQLLKENRLIKPSKEFTEEKHISIYAKHNGQYEHTSTYTKHIVKFYM